MSQHIGNLPEEVTSLLDGSAIPWSVIPGRRHNKVVVGGRLVGIFSKGRKRLDAGGTRDRRALQNLVAQVKRAIKDQSA